MVIKTYIYMTYTFPALQCWPQVLGFILSLVFMWAWCLLFDAVCVSCDSTESTYMVTKHAVQEWLFWAVVMVTTVVALLPRFVLQVLLIYIFSDEK